jgi:hypothetical protein
MSYALMLGGFHRIPQPGKPSAPFELVEAGASPDIGQEDGPTGTFRFLIGSLVRWLHGCLGHVRGGA